MAALPAGPEVSLHVPADGRGSRRTVDVAGELDLATAPQVRAAVAAALADGCGTLVLDLGEATFIDSSGLHLVVDADARCREVGVVLVVRPAPDPVQHVFALCGLSDQLPFIRDGADARFRR